MSKKIPVSVIVSVKNEELNLPNCLDKLSGFSEVIVVDSNSVDKTPEVVADYNYKLVNFKWNGKFPKKRNWTLENVLIKNDWVLFLDADEYLTNHFIKELTEKITQKKYKGYWLYYNNYFMGKEQKHGLKMRKLALFKKDFGRFEKIEEDNWSHLDMEIHEHPIINGDIGKFKSNILHKDYKGIEHYIARHNAYSSWEASRYLSEKSNDNLTFRQKVKYSLLSTGLLPYAYFFYTYLLKFGVLDGKSGLRLARFKSNYFLQIQTKIEESKNK